MDYTGVVTGGSARAQILGYPTANISLTDASVSGVYAARVTVEGIEHKAVAFADPSRKVLEAHLFDFNGNLYGKEITISLVKKLRDTAIFTDDASLKEAMHTDAENARSALS